MSSMQREDLASRPPSSYYILFRVGQACKPRKSPKRSSEKDKSESLAAEWDPHLLDLESLESESWQRFPAS